MIGHLSDANSNRVAQLSLLAAIMVVFFHVPDGYAGTALSICIKRFIIDGICSIAVPFFFVVSGYMLTRHTDELGWWRMAMRKRVRTILIPFICWIFISTVAQAVLIIITNLISHAPLSRNLIGLFNLSQFGLNPFADPPQPYWYLRTLMLFVLLSPIVVRIIEVGKRIAIIYLFSLWLLYLVCFVIASYFPGWERFFSHLFSAFHLFFFSMGVYICRYAIVIKHRMALFVFFLACTGTVLHIAMSATCFPSQNYLINMVIHVVFKSSVILTLASFWLWMPRLNLPSWLLTLSFPIYVVHDIVLDYIKVISRNLTDTYNDSLFMFFVIGFSGVIVSIILSKIMLFITPTIASILFGGRVKQTHTLKR